ncbi:hypothetical protein SRM_01318 [Salinibacter ruber M8]|uniref:Uncharacterized protein n=1 Tax=Salinibacter ruber (strain M8) TaxID=761659 RepID=D5H884_SALRM|nr:hypothetical protein SRM_01318 [Salinibacter ruber M8]
MDGGLFGTEGGRVQCEMSSVGALPRRDPPKDCLPHDDMGRAPEARRGAPKTIDELGGDFRQTYKLLAGAPVAPIDQ